MINDLAEFFLVFFYGCKQDAESKMDCRLEKKVLLSQFYSRLLLVVMGAQVCASVLVKSIVSFYDF